MWKYHKNARTKNFFIIISVFKVIHLNKSAPKRVFSKCYLVSFVFRCKYHAKNWFHQTNVSKNHVFRHIGPNPFKIFRFCPQLYMLTIPTICLIFARHMKIVKIEGSLGLQMFQYALYLAIKTICNDAYMTGRKLLPCEIFNLSENALLNSPKIKLPWQSDPYKGFHFIQNPTDAEDLKNLPDNCIIAINEPSYLCFDHIETLVKQEFHITQASATHEIETVAMHITAPSRQNDTSCTSDYYNWAIANINTFAPDTVFHVFTDNAKWVARNIKGLPENTIVTDCRNINRATLMQIMASASHVIMADSFTDWWAAYLNANHDKIIIAPQRWCCTNATKELLLPYWTIIPVT